MVAKADEIGSPIEVSSISWHRAAGGTPTASFNNFNIYMGYCPQEMLGTSFMDNYIQDSRTLVHHSGSITVAEGTDEWFTIELDTPFSYDGEGSLILEVAWSSGSGSVHNYFFDAPGSPMRLKSAEPEAATGILSSSRCQFMLNGTQALENGTWASVKILLGAE